MNNQVGIVRRIGLVLLAAALCLGLMPAAAWAEKGEGVARGNAAGTVTLTIVKGVSEWSGPSVIVNKTYEFTGQATVEDLFEAARDAGDIGAFSFADAFGSGSAFLSSLTPSGGGAIEGATGWWSSFVGGAPDSDGSKTAAASLLVDGEALQFAWCDSVPNIAPTTEQWKALGSSATKGAETAGDAAKPAAGNAALAIVQGVGWEGPVAVVNKTYDINEDATVADLLAAAKASGDIKDYAFNGYGYLDSVTTAGGAVIKTPADWSASWSIYKNGSAAGFDQAKPNEGKDVDVLADGDALQFAWCDGAPNVAPSADQWSALARAAAPSGSKAEGAVAIDPSPSASKVDVALLDESSNEVFRSLFANLTAALEGVGGASERNVSSWKALEAAAIGRASDADVDAAIADAAAAYHAPDGFNVQRSIIVLTALGVDAAAVPTKEGALDLVGAIANDAQAVSAYPTSMAFTLLAYASGPYDVKADAVNAPRAIIDRLAAAQSDKGGYLALGAVDVDTTAMAIPALAAYQGDAVAKAALDKAVAALLGTQKSDGGFGNVNSTAVALVALCAAGVDPATGRAGAGSATPLNALLSQAKEDLSGFSVATGMQQDMVDEQGLRALVAYQGLKNTGAAYNLYTQAKLGQAALPAEQQETQKDDARTDARSEASKGAGGSALAKTGDGAAAGAAGAAAIALGALAASIVAARGLRRRDERRVRG